MAFASNDTYDRALLQAELQRDEGVQDVMYRDTRGFWTVGVGHCLSIPQSQFTISALFQDDTNGAEAALDAKWPWWRNLSQVRQRVMMGLMFNMGTGTLSGFPKFLAAMESGDWQTASAELGNSAYAREVGQRCIRYQYMIENDTTEPGEV